MLRLFGLGLLGAVLMLSGLGVDTGHADPKIKGRQQSKPDQAATMTAIALAESGGNTRRTRKGRALRQKP